MASSSTSSSAKSSGADRTRILEEFFARDTREVAIALLGKVLVVGRTAVRIVETEAYRADDPASHSCRGETPRSAVMFGEPGVAYGYLIYGMYEMLNFVTEPKGAAGAVLIRAGEPLEGVPRMRARRPVARREHDLASGPGKLCAALGVRLADNRASIAGPRFSVHDDGFALARSSIRCSPRVGIRVGIDAYWRYFIDGNACVSRARENLLARPLRRSGGFS